MMSEHALYSNSLRKCLQDMDVTYMTVSIALVKLADKGTERDRRNLIGLADLFLILNENDQVNFRMLIACRPDEFAAYLKSFLVILHFHSNVDRFDLLYEIYKILNEIMGDYLRSK